MGWIFINIIVPTLSPVLLMACYMPFRDKLQSQYRELVRFISPIKDGQLSWAGIAFCAAALYEMYEAKKAGRGLSEAYDGPTQVILISLLVLNSVLAAGGSIFPVELPRPAGIKIRHFYAAMWNSFILAGTSAGFLTAVHFAVSEH